MKLASKDCPCGWLIGLMIVEGEPVGWDIVDPDDEDTQLETIAAAGAIDAIHELGREPTRQEREALTRARERDIVSVTTFTPTTVCECGRRYRALNRQPWIEAAE